jgi:hypothetical protein
VYNELTPDKIYVLAYSELHLITKELFSPSVQNDEEAISDYYYKLSEIYMNYETDDDSMKKKAYAAAQKLLEIIYFRYPKSEKADDALWETAGIIREFGVEDVLSESDCYKKIVNEYKDSIFVEESKRRLEELGSDTLKTRNTSSG